MNKDELKEICDLTFRLTELRQNECKHLSVENTAHEIFGKLIREIDKSEKKESAVKTLKGLNYTYKNGAELWRPPLGDVPKHIYDREQLLFDAKIIAARRAGLMFPEGAVDWQKEYNWIYQHEFNRMTRNL